MMYRCSRERLTIAFFLLSAAFPLICSQNVKGVEGESITLPCSYKVRQSSDITTMCWGRGSCPSSKCNEVLIWTDGRTVTQRSSERYQLNGKIEQGQISLTISKASMSDAGTYCCRIEHQGWFNDEKKNIRLSMEKEYTMRSREYQCGRTHHSGHKGTWKLAGKAPTTTPPTTTTRRTSPSTTRPPVRKTTPPPTTEKATTPPPTSERTTTPLPTSKIISTLLPISLRTTITVPTGEDTTTVPTGEETKETTTVPTAGRTTTPQPPLAGSTSAPAATTTVPSPPLSTIIHTTPPNPAIMDETTTETLSPSTVPFVICDYSHELINPHEAFDHHHPRGTLPSEPASHSSENGIADLFSGNITTVVKKESGLALHILITAICVSVIVLIVVSLLIMKFRSKERGHHLFGLDPNLELVSHAEVGFSETDAEISQAVTLEVDKVELDKPTL